MRIQWIFSLGAQDARGLKVSNLGLVMIDTTFLHLICFIGKTKFVQRVILKVNSAVENCCGS